MISLRNLKMKKVIGMLDTNEKVQELRINLEEATEEDFKNFREAKRRVWHKSRSIVLD